METCIWGLQPFTRFSWHHTKASVSWPKWRERWQRLKRAKRSNHLPINVATRFVIYLAVIKLRMPLPNYAFFAIKRAFDQPYMERPAFCCRFSVGPSRGCGPFVCKQIDYRVPAISRPCSVIYTWTVMDLLYISHSGQASYKRFPRSCTMLLQKMKFVVFMLPRRDSIRNGKYNIAWSVRTIIVV
jgi:hypothetical protein